MQNGTDDNEMLSRFGPPQTARYHTELRRASSLVAYGFEGQTTR
jgi:hypothetical protein